MIRGQDATEFNNKVHAFTLMFPDWVDADDANIFPTVPPPEVRPAGQTRPVRAGLPICQVCQDALEYFAYYVENAGNKSSHNKDSENKDSTDRDSDPGEAGLQSIVIHHRDLHSFMKTWNSGCHLCAYLGTWLSTLGIPQEEFESFLSDHKIELCWLESAGKLDAEAEPGRLRMNFAIINKGHERTSQSYYNFLRIQLWPKSICSELFSLHSEIPSGNPSETPSGTPSQGPSSSASQVQRWESELPERKKPTESDDGERRQDDGQQSHEEDVEKGDERDDEDDQNEHERERESEDEEEGELEDEEEEEGGEEYDEGKEERGATPKKVRLYQANTGSNASRELALRWLSRCQRNEDGKHAQCSAHGGSSWLPTRLIDVTYALETSQVRLVSPTRSPDAFTSDKNYITLSHCWGEWGPRGIPSLKCDNEESRYQQGVSMDAIPQTFKDAITIAGWFEVRWLWIDSLCIVQDSGEDWNREALLMCQVYKHALLNIAADYAFDAREGCFHERNPLVIVPISLTFPGIGEIWHATIDARSMFRWTVNAPLLQRAWVHQERHLARRVLHFSKKEIVWECCAEGPYFASETFPNGAPLKRLFDGKPKMQTHGSLDAKGKSGQKLHRLWDGLCETYSEKQLSKKEDKLIALSGLRKEFEDLFPGDTCLAGHWRSRLPSSLLWTTKENQSDESSTKMLSIAPSWSWASVDGPVELFRRFETRTIQCVSALTDVLELLKQEHVREHSPNIKLEISGFLRQVTVKDNHAEDTLFPPVYNNKQELIMEDSKDRLSGISIQAPFFVEHDLDTKSETVHAYLLFVEYCRPEPESQSSLRGLLLRPSDEENTFERIGTLRIEGKHTVMARYKLKQEVEAREKAWISLQDTLRRSWVVPRKPEDGDEGGETGTTDDNQPSIRPADPMALYDLDDPVDEGRYERLVPQTIRLV